MRLLRVDAYSDQDAILIRVATDAGVREATIAVPDNRTEEQVLRSLRVFDAGRFD